MSLIEAGRFPGNRFGFGVPLLQDQTQGQPTARSGKAESSLVRVFAVLVVLPHFAEEAVDGGPPILQEAGHMGRPQVAELASRYDA